MIDYTEKRDFHRMTLGCPARYRPQGANRAEHATVDNLSNSGVMLIAQQAVAADTEMNLEVTPGKTITPPLSARVRVLRCEPRDDGSYGLVCTIQHILQDNEVGADFP